MAWGLMWHVLYLFFSPTGSGCVQSTFLLPLAYILFSQHSSWQTERTVPGREELLIWINYTYPSPGVSLHFSCAQRIFYELMCPVDMLLKAVACPLRCLLIWLWSQHANTLVLWVAQRTYCTSKHTHTDFRLYFALKPEYVYEKHHMQHS